MGPETNFSGPGNLAKHQEFENVGLEVRYSCYNVTRSRRSFIPASITYSVGQLTVGL